VVKKEEEEKRKAVNNSFLKSPPLHSNYQFYSTKPSPQTLPNGGHPSGGV